MTPLVMIGDGNPVTLSAASGVQVFGVPEHPELPAASKASSVPPALTYITPFAIAGYDPRFGPVGLVHRAAGTEQRLRSDGRRHLLAGGRLGVRRVVCSRGSPGARLQG
jgi:hypothetical protein